MPIRSFNAPSLHEHANAENTVAQVIGFAAEIFYASVANGGTILSKAITITQKCAVVVVSMVILGAAAQASQLQRGGSDVTTETTISNDNFAGSGYKCHLQYTIEILDAGTYTYNLINTSGGNQSNLGAAIKIVAVAP